MTPDVKYNVHGDKGVHILWCSGMACIFDIQVTDLDGTKYYGSLSMNFLTNN